jgi:hypothetical protein
MEILKPTEVKAIEQFFQLRQNRLLKVMDKFLRTKYDKVFCTKDYVIAVGDIPVALVAHMDTVFATPPENIFYDRVKNVMWSPDGLGADDRAGVYSIVQILKEGLKPSIILTTEEERGGIGASKILSDFPKPPMDLKYLIELDRHGSLDCVFYDCDNPEFEEYVETFGFVTAWGTFTDISILCPGWGIAGVNLSIGYEDEHSYSELLYVGRMFSTIKKVIKMLEAASDEEVKQFEYIPMEYTKYMTKLYGEYMDDYGWSPEWGVSKEQWKAWVGQKPEVKECKYCGNKDFDYNLFPTKGVAGTFFICADCIANQHDKIGWCLECNDPFELKPEETNKALCYDCREKGDIKINVSDRKD